MNRPSSMVGTQKDPAAFEGTADARDVRARAGKQKNCRGVDGASYRLVSEPTRARVCFFVFTVRRRTERTGGVRTNDFIDSSDEQTDGYARGHSIHPSIHLISFHSKRRRTLARP
jgi:hypothetical protein